MAEGGGDFVFYDPKLDRAINNDTYDDDDEQKVDNDPNDDDDEQSTEPSLFSRAHLQLHITVGSNTKCKRCSTSRAGCRLMMKEPLLHQMKKPQKLREGLLI